MRETPQPQNRFLARQMQKRHLATSWATLAGLQPGMTILDIGSGPGLLAAAYANLIGPTGTAYALEPDAMLHDPPENLIHLRQDAAAPINLPQKPHIVFITDTLHHAADPHAVLRSIHAVCGPETKILIAEYDPAQPGRVGAKPERRLPPAATLAFLAAAGFAVTYTGAAPDEHYVIIAHPA